MAERTLIANVNEDSNNPGTFIVRSPAVGIVDGVPMLDIFLNPFDRVLTINILNRRFVLRLPRDSQGRVTELFIPDSHSPVNYGTPIARLDPRALVESGKSSSISSYKSEDISDLTSEVIKITSPTAGIFYRRPSPDQPPYVEFGSKIKKGSVIGLVEVMKCFNQIQYGGPDLPLQATVKDILVEDTSEVTFGEVLVIVEPDK